MNFSVGFGARLKEERERKGMSQADFGALGGVGKLAQLNYEKGERSPSAEYLNAIESHGVDVGYLLTGNKGKPATGAEEPTVDCALLEAVLRALANKAVQYRLNLGPDDSARLAAAIYKRMTIDPERNDPAAIHWISEMALDLWKFSQPQK